ncbi:tyrosine-protein phosphatase [Microbacterium sp. Marseille-Q6965]|uniref:tyrosine-protein phosphatase n=1 Tax=Microbacterium sp. Marseille-Q6965 TaxID=2965072 RepID=UPI0021B84481|nr:tyrosine-protein phosphatase [Microbacterium sp. Marseille-Q6965]
MSAVLHNLRDVGGLRARDGVVTTGRLYRSAAPLRDDPGIGDMVRALGIGTVVDLRDPRERELSPAVWARAGLHVREVPVFGGRLASIRFDTLGELYEVMIERHIAAVVAAVEAVASAPGPVLVHCTAGKDRTGVVTALILEALGVAREDVLADFARSEEVLGEAYLRDLFAGVDMSRLPGGAAHRAVSSPPHLLRGALERIDARHGGAEALLREHAASDAVGSLTAALIVPAAEAAARIGHPAATT